MVASCATAPKSASVLMSRSLLLERNGPGQASGPLHFEEGDSQIPSSDSLLACEQGLDARP